MKKNIQTRGFTLAEILIAITLMGILATIILPRFSGHLDKARTAEAVNMLGAIRQAELTYRNGPAGVFLGILATTDSGWSCADPALWAQLGIQDPNTNSNSAFGYCIDYTDFTDATTPLGSVFRAVARQKNADPDVDGSIALNQTGVWSGNHLYTPQNQNGADCGDGTGGTLPGPCW